MALSLRAPRRLACGLAAAALFAGCGPTSKRLRQEIREGAPGAYIPGVPFVRQHRNQCGPAALASVAQYCGLGLSQEQIASEVFLSSIQATLTIDLQYSAEKHGLWTWAGKGTVDDVRAWLDRGVPVIALLKLGFLEGGTWHYVVVNGYHAGRRRFIAHTGYLSNRPLPFEKFARESGAAGGWILAACPPDRVAWPLDADGHNRLGLLHERAGRLDRARAEYQSAAEARPGEALYPFNLGNALARLGKPAEAEKAYRQAVALKPAFADAHNNLASLLLDLGRGQEALLEARRAIEIDGIRAACYQDTLGRVLLALERYRDAAAAFRRSIDQAKGDPEITAGARLGLIEALARAGDRGEALAERDRLLAGTADPDLRRRAEGLLK